MNNIQQNNIERKERINSLGVDNYHQVRIIYPVRFFVSPNRFDKSYKVFDKNNIWLFGDDTLPIKEQFINTNSRFHEEISYIFQTDNKMFRLYLMKDDAVTNEDERIIPKIKNIIEQKHIVAPIMKLGVVRAYLFESGVGFVEFGVNFKWNKSVDDNEILNFCKIISKTKYDFLNEIVNGYFGFEIKGGNNINYKSKNTCANIDVYTYPTFYFSVHLDRYDDLSGFFSDFRRNTHIHYEMLQDKRSSMYCDGRVLIRAGKYKWEINDQAALFCFIFVLHQMYAIRTLSNELLKIDNKNNYSRCMFLSFRLRKEEISYLNFRRRYVFENISERVDVEQIYDYIKEKMEICKLDNEYVMSIKPLQEHYRNIVEKTRNRMLFALSFITFANIFLTSIIDLKTIDCLTKSKPIIFGVCIICTVIWTLIDRLILINKQLCIKNVKKKRKKCK